VLAKVRLFCRRSATSLPWILIVLALAAPDRARADDTPWVDVRHQVGFQAGGSGFFQLVYRYRFLGPLSVDVGGMGSPPDAVLANLSLGLVAAFRNRTRFVPYLGSGVGFAVDAGPAKGCDQSTNTDCPTVGNALLVRLWARRGRSGRRRRPTTYDQPRRRLLVRPPRLEQLRWDLHGHHADPISLANGRALVPRHVPALTGPEDRCLSPST
jgi:hypothetical protein